MIALVQRVKYASVKVDEKTVSQIKDGFLVLLGVYESDGEKECELLAKKTANLRIFSDENGKMNVSPANLVEKGENCEILAVSQFTLCAQCKGQNRPSFISAASPDAANALYEKYVSLLNDTYKINTHKGVFGADMKVELLNDGPVTIILDTDKL